MSSPFEGEDTPCGAAGQCGLVGERHDYQQDEHHDHADDGRDEHRRSTPPTGGVRIDRPVDPGAAPVAERLAVREVMTTMFTEADELIHPVIIGVRSADLNPRDRRTRPGQPCQFADPAWRFHTVLAAAAESEAIDARPAA